jgi:putative oxidoreductase
MSDPQDLQQGDPMQSSPALALLLTRLGFGAFLLVWGLNKIVNPAHTQAIFDNFYGIGGLSAPLAVVLGLLQVGLSLMIIAGLYRTLSYGLGVVIHAASTIATAPHLLLPFAEGSNLLFMAAVPVLLSAIGLFLARNADTLLSLDGYLGRSRPGTYSRQPW